MLGKGANGLSDGDGAVGDPASLGVFAVMLGGVVYGDAARGEVEFILGQALRWGNGAISQRVDVPELWCVLFPPF